MAITKYDQTVVVMVAVEEFERINYERYIRPLS